MVYTRRLPLLGLNDATRVIKLGSLDLITRDYDVKGRPVVFLEACSAGAGASTVLLEVSARCYIQN